MSQSRQLAAIMFTDIVGYTALMGKDSAKALELVRISKEIQKPIVEKNHGQWLKEMGDGALVKFGTALDAVNCAIEIQELARAKLDGKLRIGIHSGDITMENDDVYGDGVNVASRLESIADPGGIYISDAIEKAIRGQSDIQAKYLGESRLKNVDYGVRTYAVQGVGMPIPEVKEDKQLSGHLWAEVQRRGVIQAGATYVVLSLLLILLLPYANSLVNLPTWSSTALLGILIAGFPAALYLAWNYERSPEGFVKTTSQQSWQNPLSPSQRKPFTGTFIIAGLVLVLAFMFFYPRFQSSGQESETPESVLESRVIDKSIVVLPFTNISSDPEQEYFSDGMMEEILNHLVKIKDLKVISRTTAMQYKGTLKSVREITKELNVTNALEGSVRKDGDQIRITVQLIEGNTDTHLWSESYDRQLANILDVQSDVAQQIVQVLQVEISPETKLRIESQRPSIVNEESYLVYLQARQKLNLRGEQNLIKATELFEDAIKLDSNFDLAYSGLGRALLLIPYFSEPYDGDPVVEPAKSAASKAISINPINSEAYIVLGNIAFYDWDWSGAEQVLKRALAIDPNNAEVFNILGDYYLIVGDLEKALEMESKALELDPLRAVNHHDLGMVYGAIGDWEHALKFAISAVDLHLDFSRNNVLLFKCYIELGLLGQAESMVNEFEGDSKHIVKARIAISKNKIEEALSSINEINDKGRSWVAELYLLMDMNEEAISCLTKSYINRRQRILGYFFEIPPNHPVVKAAIREVPAEVTELFEIISLNLKNNELGDKKIE